VNRPRVGISGLRLQFDLHAKKIEIGKVFARAIVILIAGWSLLSSCANTREAAETDSNSILHEPERDHEVYGELGACTVTARDKLRPFSAGTGGQAFTLSWRKVVNREALRL
jgi:hypothetical protein